MTSTITFNISKNSRLAKGIYRLWMKYHVFLILIFLVGLSSFSFLIYYQNGLGLDYNDARSHLDIGRRVVEGLKPGLAQLGSVWLPLPHILMIPTIWIDFMWHSGLSGAMVSMVSFVATGVLIYQFLKHLNVGLTGRIFGVLVFVLNINILYMQSTAMTELLLIATMTGGAYYLIRWHKYDHALDLIKASFFVMLATLIRYDGWFLFLLGGGLVILKSFLKQGYKAAEGKALFYATLAGFGIVLWLLWNLLIFKDQLYFVFGPYAAYAQQTQLESAGVLQTKYNAPLSALIYLYALAYNSNAFYLILAM